MKFLAIMALGLLTLGSLTACNVSARDGNNSISVSDDDDRYHGENHCPPGHAKKGWC